MVEVGLEVGGLDARRLLPRLADLDRVALLLLVERLDLRGRCRCRLSDFTETPLATLDVTVAGSATDLRVDVGERGQPGVEGGVRVVNLLLEAGLDAGLHRGDRGIVRLELGCRRLKLRGVDEVSAVTRTAHRASLWKV